MYPIITIMGYALPSQDFFAVLGFIVSAALAVIIGKLYKTGYKNILRCLVAVAVGAFVGSHIIYAAINYRAFIKIFEGLSDMTFKQIIASVVRAFDGVVFYGGFFGALIGLGIYNSKREKQNKKKTVDMFAVCVPLFYCFSKIGCFLGGCCYGIENKYGIKIDSIKRIPVALIEVYLYLMLFLLLLKFFNINKLRGRLVYLFMLNHSAICFGAEYLREEKTGIVLFGFSLLQYASALVFVIAFFYFLFHSKSFFKDLFSKGDGNLPTNKNIFKTIALWILTFGIYGIVIMTSVSKNINKAASLYDKKRTMNYCLLFFLVGPITLGIGHIVWGYRLAKRVDKELSRRNIDYLFTKNDFWLWNILGMMVLVGPLVYLHKLFKAVNLINADYNKQG